MTKIQWNCGDLVTIVEDPVSFMIGEDICGQTGIIIKIDQEKEIYTVLLGEGKKLVKVLDFMMQKISFEEKKSNRGRRSLEQ